VHYTTTFNPSSSSAMKMDGGPFPGFDLAYGGNIWYWKRLRIGYEFGFGLLPINMTATENTLPGTASQTTYSFNTGLTAVPGPPPSGPDSPYHGPFRAPPGSLGVPTIGTQSNIVSRTDIPGASMTGTQTLDVILYTFRLGPTVYWDFNHYLGMSVGAGPAMGVVSGSLKYDETIYSGTTAHSTGQINATDLVYGGYVNATVMYHVRNDADIFIGVQYMPMSNAGFSGGGREGRLDLSGQLDFSFGISWPF
jgi:hypothetical protein